MSKFDYTYNALGTIATWTTKADAGTSIVNTLTYDNADQLTNDVQSGGGSATDAFAYDPAGNRLAETTGSSATASQFNNLNQLTAISSSTTNTTVAGHTSAPIANATVNAVTATITSGTNFSATVPLLTGTNVVSVISQDSSSNSETSRFGIVATGSSPTTLAYDANGNTTTDENGNTYKWDALNRLTEIDYFGLAKSQFSYDGLSRRVQDVETDSTGAVTTKNYLWVGQEIAEERDASNTVTKRFFPQGEQQLISSTLTPFYYFRDHIFSVHEMMDASGNLVSRLAYDPYGRVTVVSGTNLPTKQYAGMYMHQPSRLNLTQAGDGKSTGRPYKSNTGTWPTRDPIEERGGLNLYDYVRNDPIDRIDPLGLMAASTSTEVQGFVGMGYTAVTCCDENCNRHIFYYKKVCIGISAEAGFSVGAVTNMTGVGCRADRYAGWFFEFGVGVGFGGGSAALGLNGVNDTGGGPGKGGFKSTWCYYTLIGQKDFKGGCGK